MEKYKLYVVPTPIGNLKDITLRALEVLRKVDIICCEDTRHTKTLLQEYNIDKKLISYHEYNEEESTRGIIKYINEGKILALVSDAGMPTISDPGYFLINALIKENIPFTVLPGPSASITALVRSGFPTDKFAFLGFFPRKKKDQEDLINRVRDLDISLIFYESPKRIREVMNFLKEEIPKREICLVREISKIYEESKIFYAEDFDEKSVVEKGEYIFLIKAKENKVKLANTQIQNHIRDLEELGYSNKDIANILSKLFDINKNKIKKILIENK